MEIIHLILRLRIDDLSIRREYTAGEYGQREENKASGASLESIFLTTIVPTLAM